MIETYRGIQVGDSVEDLLKAYGGLESTFMTEDYSKVTQNVPFDAAMVKEYNEFGMEYSIDFSYLLLGGKETTPEEVNEAYEDLTSGEDSRPFISYYISFDMSDDTIKEIRREYRRLRMT